MTSIDPTPLPAERGRPYTRASCASGTIGRIVVEADPRGEVWVSAYSRRQVDAGMVDTDAPVLAGLRLSTADARALAEAILTAAGDD